jgi:hypothetical protein
MTKIEAENRYRESSNDLREREEWYQRHKLHCDTCRTGIDCEEARKVKKDAEAAMYAANDAARELSNESNSESSPST